MQIIPGIYEIIKGEATISRIKDVDVEDLLGRDPITLDNEGIKTYISNKVILVTGGGGNTGNSDLPAIPWNTDSDDQTNSPNTPEDPEDDKEGKSDQQQQEADIDQLLF